LADTTGCFVVVVGVDGGGEGGAASFGVSCLGIGSTSEVSLLMAKGEIASFSPTEGEVSVFVVGADTTVSLTLLEVVAVSVTRRTGVSSCGSGFFFDAV
jgi:hypothetical protein